MIRITATISISEDEIEEDFLHSSGPGGQNVNKVSTAVQLRFKVVGSRSLPGDVRDRLVRLGGRRVTSGGILIINARRFRTQERNRQDALERLVELIRKAAVRPISRRKTEPTLAARRRRLEAKHLRGRTKRLRGPVAPSED